MNADDSNSASPRRGLITPRTLKGFRDFLPEAMMPRERLIETAKRVYRSYGFSPIDTPALEYWEILGGKGSEETDKQTYKFIDHGGREVALRFDLTVPLARFVAQHIHTLGTPFKRYHIATVWRGENTQRGRYREFMQCDFDTIGTKSVVADIEMVLVIYDLMRAIGFERFTIHVNNRMILNGLLDKLGLADRSAALLRVLDKLSKVGAEQVLREMQDSAGASRQQAEHVLNMASLQGNNQELLAQLEPIIEGSSVGEEGLTRLRQVIDAVEDAGLAQQSVQLDVAIARGLDYYTGIIVETTLDDLPGIGSVCSGGRYDNLAELYTKQQLPGVGASLGLDRLLAAMDELGMLEKTSTPAQVLIVYFDQERLLDYLRLAAQLRSAGYSVELYPESKKLGQQLKYADQRGFRAALIIGEQEFASGNCQLKDLRSKQSHQLPLEPDARSIIVALANLS